MKESSPPLDFFNSTKPSYQNKHMLAPLPKIKEEAANYDEVVNNNGTDTLEETA